MPPTDATPTWPDNHRSASPQTDATRMSHVRISAVPGVRRCPNAVERPIVATSSRQWREPEQGVDWRIDAAARRTAHH